MSEYTYRNGNFVMYTYTATILASCLSVDDGSSRCLDAKSTVSRLRKSYIFP
jgi:hypothetical protein